MAADPRKSYAWKQLRLQVIREEPACWLRLPGCTVLSTCADHVLTVRDRPDLALTRANLRGACSNCNNKRNSKRVDQLERHNPAPALDFFA